MTAEREEWEFSKENIQPLQRGRNPDVMKVALNQPEEIMSQRQAFENELRTYTGDDPLSVWCNYIKWVEQNFIKGGREGHVMQLMQKCISDLRDEKKYYDDDRFINIWLKFAPMCSKPLEIYNHMFSHKIGCQRASFFIAWSWELEQLGNVKKADQVLTSGLQHRAEPFDQLKSYRANFEMRVATKGIPEPEEQALPQESENGRLAFAVLKPQKKKNAPVARVGEAVSRNRLTLGRNQQPAPKSNVPSTKAPFKIYTSENIGPALPMSAKEPATFAFHSDVSKENDSKPSKWNVVKSKQNPMSLKSLAESKPAFELHCDREQDPRSLSTPQSVSKLSNVLRQRKGEQSPPLFLFEPHNPMVCPMYDKKNVYAGAVEFSLEELRAAEWFKLQKESEEKKIMAETQRKLIEQENYIKRLEEQLKNAAATSTIKQQVSTNGKAEIEEQPKEINQSRRELFPEHKLANSYTQGYSLSDLYNGTLHSNSLGTSQKYTENQHGSNSGQAVSPFSFFRDNTTSSTQPKGTSVHSDPVENLPKAIEPVSAFSIFKDSSVAPEQLIEPAKNLPKVAETASAFSIFKDRSVTSVLPSATHQEPAKILPKVAETESAFSIFRDISAQSKITSTYHTNLYEPADKFAQPTSAEQLFQDKATVPQDHFYDEDENDENRPPSTYVQQTKKRDLQGILEPSRGIEYIPLELQEAEVDDVEDEILTKNMAASLEDDTINIPANTAQFTAAAFLASTPRSKVKLEVNPDVQDRSNVKNTQNQLAKAFEAAPTHAVAYGNASNHLTRVDQGMQRDQSRFPTQLSVIMECSRETYKSTSSSGSSASTTKLSQLCYSHEKSAAFKYFPRNDFKTPFHQGIDVSHFDQKPGPQKGKTREDEVFEIHVSETNPFDKAVNNGFLQSLNANEDYFGKLSICKSSINTLKVGEEFLIHDDAYCISNLIAEGAYGKVYKVKDVFRGNNGKTYAIKVCKRTNNWELYICMTLRDRLKALSSSPTVDASIMSIVYARGYKDGIVLVDDFHEKGTLLHLVNVYKKQNSTVPEALAMYLAYEMLQTVSKIHECGILHCDIKPDNILIRDVNDNMDVLGVMSKTTSLIKIIDFGRAIDLNFFKKGVCFDINVQDGCIEMKQNRPWVHQLDWYGVLNCVHVILFSDYMNIKQLANGRWTIENKFKRYNDKTVWGPLFDELLNIPACYQQPDIKKLTSLIEQKIQANTSGFYTKLQKTMYMMKDRC